MEADDRDLIRRAAALAVADGDARRRLAAELQHLAAVYRRDRELAGDPPSAKKARDRFAAGARFLAMAQAAIELSEWDMRLLEAGPGVPFTDGLAERLAEVERAFRRTERDLDDDVRKKLENRPGGHRWAFAWELTTLWAGAGQHVGTAPAGRYRRFAGLMFTAVGEPLPVSMLEELADKWNRHSPPVALQSEKAPEALLRQG